MSEPSTPSLKERLRALRDHLLTDLIERDTPVRLALLAALAGEHLLLLGPPGTAKSELARRLRAAFRDANYFERLLTRFTVPEELFGPLSIKALEEDRYQRQVAGYLPAASIAFLDEIFKANSAILNSLLTLLNEREFDNGTQRISTPLVCVVGASNELPSGEEMHALYDRFLLRCHVGRVSDEGFAKLMELRGTFKPSPDLSLRLSLDDLSRIQTDARLVKVPADVATLLKALRKHCQELRIDVSERRWRKVLFLLQVAAYTDGRNEISQWDCWLLQHCLWEQPEQREPLFDWYKTRVGAVAGSPDRFAKIVVTWERALEEDRRRYSHVCNEQGQPLYVAHDGTHVVAPKGKIHRKNKNNELLYTAPQHYTHRPDNSGNGYTEDELRSIYEQHVRHFDTKVLSNPQYWLLADGKLEPVLEAARYPEAYVRSRLDQVGAVQTDLSHYLTALDKQLESLQKWMEGHLWISPGFAPTALQALQTLRADHGKLSDRLLKAIEGFKSLPRSTK